MRTPYRLRNQPATRRCAEIRPGARVAGLDGRCQSQALWQPPVIRTGTVTSARLPQRHLCRPAHRTPRRKLLACLCARRRFPSTQCGSRRRFASNACHRPTAATHAFPVAAQSGGPKPGGLVPLPDPLPQQFNQQSNKQIKNITGWRHVPPRRATPPGYRRGDLADSPRYQQLHMATGSTLPPRACARHTCIAPSGERLTSTQSA